MSYLGSWKVDDLLTFPAITHRFDTGALTDADAVPAYRVYEDETGTAILTGNMAKLDDANTLGFYSEQITLSAANGFEKGKCYTVYITAAVNSVTGGQHHTFQMEAEVDANTISSTGAALSAIPWAAAWDAEVQSEVADALAVYDPPTNAEMEARTIAAANYSTAAALATAQTSIDDLPTNAELATALGTADDAVLVQVALVKAKTDNLPSDPADQSLVIAATDALATLIGDVPTNAELATALGTADDALLTQVGLVKTVTDKFVFGVANVVNANITHVNEVAVNGAGTAGSPWGP